MKQIDNPIVIRKKALEEIHHIIDKKNIPDGYGLRIGIKGAGCSGLGYLLGFDKQKEDDLAYKVDGIDVYIDKKHTMYIIGMEVDFYEGGDARGFTFINPQAEMKDNN
ncbi:MAG: iron-sulfur cluster assembly accessory protein [Cyclobacteriaceae bacterium]